MVLSCFFVLPRLFSNLNITVFYVKVFYAIKDAIVSARKQNLGDESYFEMRMPATSERIRMYSADPIAGKAASIVTEGKKEIQSFQPQGSF